MPLAEVVAAPQVVVPLLQVVETFVVGVVVPDVVVLDEVVLDEVAWSFPSSMSRSAVSRGPGYTKREHKGPPRGTKRGRNSSKFPSHSRQEVRGFEHPTPHPAPQKKQTPPPPPPPRRRVY